MRVVVTGGSGRLGQFVLRELFTHAHQVSAIDAVKPRECPCPTYVVDLNKVEALIEQFKKADAVIHLARQRFPYTESGFNSTTQRWERPDVAGDAARFNANVAMTNNVLAGAQAAGVKKVVCGSSLAIYGLYYPVTDLPPDYLPIDEEHPLRPQDPYGLSKVVGEKLCDALSQKSGMQIASLRFSGIYTEEHRALLAERKKSPTIRGTGALWSYIDVRDAARACRLALEANFSGHQAFNICAPDTIMDISTRELVSRYLSQVMDLREGLTGRNGGYSVAKAKAMLEFEAKLLLEHERST
ncbi:MAG: NAD(P)-dependent oxidoreductase [Deltaproteobacteria bacterium]|nr:NAD(P)-dependent oxidoreductase [Deltaproteobacteria bacterium]